MHDEELKFCMSISLSEREPSALESTQPLKISTRILLGVKTVVRKADDLPPS
jgi:hypothetical protein